MQQVEKLNGTVELVRDYHAFDPFIWDKLEAVAIDVRRILGRSEQELQVYSYDSPFAGVVHFTVKDEELEEIARKLAAAGYLIHGSEFYREGESALFFGMPVKKGTWERGEHFRLEFFTPHYNSIRNEAQLCEFERRVSELINGKYELHCLIGAGNPERPMCAVLVGLERGVWE